jgi:hypothetical protein
MFLLCFALLFLAPLWSVSALLNRADLVGWTGANLQPTPVQPTLSAYYQSTPPTPGCNGFITEFVLHSCQPCPFSSRIINPENNQNEDFNIFPNPTYGIFNITLPKLDETAEITIDVYDVLGKEIFVGKSIGNSLSVDITNKPEGLYIVKVNDGNDTFISKIIYQK